MRAHLTGPTTERLAHRAMVPGDAEAFFTLCSDPEVMRYTGEPPLGSVGQARDGIERYPDFDKVGFGRWGCYLRSTGSLIGFCGLKHLDDLDEVDIGFRFLPEYWGRGLATEAARACLAYGFETIGLTRVIGLVLPENAASIRVLEKIGMVSEGRIRYDGYNVLRYAAG